MTYRRRADVRVHEVQGETLILDDQHGQIHQLNATASSIWLRCDGSTSIAQIVQHLTEQFDVDEAIARKDVAEAIERFRELKLLSE
jgi:hypothetical protein